MRGTALIVGASGGIGGAIAARLARDGYGILAQGRDPERLAAVRTHVESLGAPCTTLPAELCDDVALDALAERASAEPDLAAVVWSAGGGRPVESGPDALTEWSRTLQTTLTAPMRLTARTLPAMRRTGGSYLFVCGIYAKIGMARMAAHCAGRHGLEGFAKALFEELREDGIGATLLHPGFVDTGLSDRDRLDPERMIRPADIADMASLALTMPKSACVTEMTVRPQRSPYK